MTPEREKIRERLDAATPGPWYSTPHPRWGGAPSVVRNKPNTPHEAFGEICRAHDNNAVFIANAPTDIAALLDENERLERKLEKIREVIEAAKNVSTWGSTFGTIDGCLNRLRTALKKLEDQ